MNSAGLGNFAGEKIARIEELPMLIPRGKYSLDMYDKFLKIHGKTHNYKVKYS
jgi:structure-specific recognition protein 1